jgi:hypothetical protein
MREPRSLAVRFRDRVSAEDPNACWLWTGFVGSTGYGRIGAHGKVEYAHRVAWKLLRGPIPEHLQIDHVCQVRNCVNPHHMELVTPKENIRRSSVGHVQLAKTHCPAGHPYDEANTYRSRSGQRLCRACRAERQRRKSGPELTL